MDKFLEYISHYNFFNYLFPGTLFLIYYNHLNPIFDNLETYQIVIMFFVAYFLGLLISRIGSLVVEPICKKLGIIKFSNYKDFLKAIKKDVKIETLTEQNNMNRSLIALCLICIIITVIYDIIRCCPSCIEYILFVIFLIIIILSYNKQNNYIGKRVKIANKK